MPKVPGPQTSCVSSLSTLVQMLAPGCSLVLSECFARIFSVRVIACLTCRTAAAMKRPVNISGRVQQPKAARQHIPSDVSEHTHTPPVAAGFRESTGAEGADTAAATFIPETRDLQCCTLAALGTLTAMSIKNSVGMTLKGEEVRIVRKEQPGSETCASATSESRTFTSKHARTDRRERHGVRNNK